MAMNLRCDDVARTLSASVADEAAGRADIAAHLAACPRCAAWTEAISRQDAAWAATRPTLASSDAAFDALWNGVAATPAPVLQPPRRVPYRSLAAAASVLLGLGLGWKLWNDRPEPVLTPSLPPAIAKAAPIFDVEQGQTLVIHIPGDGGVTTEYHVPTGTSDTVTVAADFEILNYMEAL